MTQHGHGGCARGRCVWPGVSRPLVVVSAYRDLWPLVTGVRTQWNKSPPRLEGGVPVTFADEIDNHKSRCRQHLVRLRILARAPDDAAPYREVPAEIRDVTSAIIAEAEAMSRAAIRAAGIRGPQAETFLWARITRLA